MAPALIAAAGPIKRLIADKAYDANSLRRLLADQGVKVVIPCRYSFDRQPQSADPIQQDHLSPA
jgi:transposase